MKPHKITILFLMAATFLSAAIGVSAQKKKPKRKSPHRELVQIIGDAVNINSTPAGPPVFRDPFDPKVVAFVEAWRAIKNLYFDGTFNGLNWDSVLKEMMPRVEAAKTNEEAEDLIREMLSRLNRSHLEVIPSSYYTGLASIRKISSEREEASENSDDADDANDDGSAKDAEKKAADMPPGRFGVGIDIRRLGENFVITSVRPGSSADKAGVRPGYVLDKINGISLAEISRRILERSPHVRHLDRLLPLAIKLWLFDRDEAFNIKITCLDENNAPKEFDLPREPLTGEMISFGNLLPSTFLDYRSRALNDDVGYVAFNTFSYQVLGKFCDSLTEFRDKKALIIDLRGNYGGLIRVMQGLAGMLEPAPISVGTSVFRGSRSDVPSDNKVKKYKGRIVLLVDGQSMSAAEILAAALQDNARAVVVGERSAGEALPSQSFPLATGAVVTVPIADYLRPKGVEVEGTGVEPDLFVPLDREKLLAGPDPVLTSAAAFAVSDQYTQRIELLKADAKKRAEAKTLADGTFGDGVSLPPPPKAKAVPKTPPAPMKEGSRKPDPKAVERIKAAAAAIGDISSWKTYSAEGLLSIGVGTSIVYKYTIIREKPDKYVVTMDSDVFGKVRFGAIGKKTFFDGTMPSGKERVKEGGDEQNDLYFALSKILSPETFVTLYDDGEFVSDGKNLSMIEGPLREKSARLYVSFDAATGLPVRVFDGNTETTFEDYRKEGEFLVPHKIKTGTLYGLLITSIKIDTPIDPAAFEVSTSCFDQP